MPDKNSSLPIVEMDTMPLRWGHFRVLFIASLGQVAGSCLATLIGVIIPLILIYGIPQLSILEQGIMASMGLLGITIGALAIGRLSDKYGYLLFFRLCPSIIFIASVILIYNHDFLPIILSMLFLMGFGIGGGYTLDSDYISEIMPRKYRQLMVGVAKANCSIGNIITAIICLLVLRKYHYASIWPYLILIMTALSLFMV